MRIEKQLEKSFLTKIEKKNCTEKEWKQTLKNLNLDKDVVEITVEFSKVFSVDKNMSSNPNEVKVDVQIEVNEEHLEKATKLVELLKEAKSLMNDLASIEFNINVK